MTLAEKLRVLRTRDDISQRELAKKTGTSYGTISRIESGQRTNVRANTLTAIAKYFRVTVEDLTDDKVSTSALLAKLEEKSKPGRGKKADIKKIPLTDLIQIPVLAYVPSGMTTEIPEGVVMGHISLPFAWVRDREAFAVIAKGDSMTGHGIQEGDYVIVSRNLEAASGSLALIEINGEVSVKKLFYRGDQVVLQPSDSKNEPIFVTDKDEFRIVGKVVFTGRRTD